MDQTIHDARQALDAINEEATDLAVEERKIRAEDTEYKKKFVRCSPFIADNTWLNRSEERS